MTLSEKIANFADRTSGITEALDIAADEIAQMEARLESAESEIKTLREALAHSDAQICRMQEENVRRIFAETKNHNLTALRIMAKTLSDSWQVSESVVWGMFVDYLRTAEFVNPMQVAPEPVEIH